MRTLAGLIVLVACHLVQPTLATAEAAPVAVQDAAPTSRRLLADTPTTTVLGNTFIAPAGWTLSVRGSAPIIEALEGDSRIVLVDVRAADGDAALAAGWAAYKAIAWPLKVANDLPDKDGWSKQRIFTYQTSPRVIQDSTVRGLTTAKGGRP